MRLASAIGLVVVCLTLASAVPARAGTATEPMQASTPAELIAAVNALRATYGLSPYSVNSTLMAAAQGHADYMAATGNMSHTGAGGSTVTERLLSLGYPLAGDLSLGGFRSENITSGNEGMVAQEAVNRWTGDSLHLNTMISTDLTEIGAGVTIHNGWVFYVIDCARPTDSGIPQATFPPAPGTTAGPTNPPGVSGIIIPVAVVTPNADGDMIHEVKAGQTLWQIAISYETKIDEIKLLNNLFDNEIYPGMKLLVRKGVFIAATGTAESPTPASLTSISAGLSPTAVESLPQTPTLPPVSVQREAGSGNTIQIVIGIIALAVLGGGVFAWWGSRRK